MIWLSIIVVLLIFIKESLFWFNLSRNVCFFLGFCDQLFVLWWITHFLFRSLILMIMHGWSDFWFIKGWKHFSGYSWTLALCLWTSCMTYWRLSWTSCPLTTHSSGSSNRGDWCEIRMGWICIFARVWRRSNVASVFPFFRMNGHCLALRGFRTITKM